MLVVYAAGSDDAADVQTVLSATNAFAKVGLLDAGEFTGCTPTPEELDPYDALLVFAGFVKWANAATLGTNLADFFDAKGRVVVAAIANTITPRLQG